MNTAVAVISYIIGVPYAFIFFFLFCAGIFWLFIVPQEFRNENYGVGTFFCVQSLFFGAATAMLLALPQIYSKETFSMPSYVVLLILIGSPWVIMTWIVCCIFSYEEMKEVMFAHLTDRENITKDVLVAGLNPFEQIQITDENEGPVEIEPDV
eukprot:TRINITY_DN688_c1_g1_i1.p1 TRINITY_DN688_c1_g1~~TRINITY_DN688_c1_g1_i1.p1  ORF type:complete len:153 (-),score=2.69 TRINITY_DN688_c1_g1_i1:373-831(-)